MLAKVYSGALIGVDAVFVEVEVNSGERGEPRVFMVGLPDAAVKESQDRVSSALSNSGYSMPQTKTTINLAPGDIRKEGPIYDLPIALGILSSTGQISEGALNSFIIAGELALSGELRGICGGVSLALLARRKKLRGVILPKDSAMEAALVEGVEVFAADNIRQVVDFLNGKIEIAPVKISDSPCSKKVFVGGLDFADVKGQYQVRRAVEVAVAGGHNLLMVGPPGSGKSMIAKRIPSIMPIPTLEEFLEILGIYSAAGLSRGAEARAFCRPFRAPHHTISDIGLIGGGSVPKPGEISLAHNGVLFLDELPEFKRSALEVMRQPLEDGVVSISRSAGKIKVPCNFMLVAAMNPCPCGYFGDPRGKCRCTPMQISRYRSKISGPLLDRIDIHVEAPAIGLNELGSSSKGESSEEIRKRVYAAREIQARRFAGSGVRDNSSMTSAQIKKYCALDDARRAMLASAMEQLNLSARAWDRILKVARTVADLDASETVKPHHLLEAINYRSLDRNS
ncbi:MAG: YifB family Mg chelatase-like AAA ATPase [Opitutales bacterium]|nr:YifB family Mg chelatase-like AAA ATPase [Opitutales bacterium]